MSEPQSPPRPPPRILWSLRASILATCVVVAAASFLPGARLWGINHLAFYSPVVRFAALLLIGVAFIPPVAGWVYSGLLAVSRKLKHGGRSVEVSLVLIAVLSIVVFVGLSASTHLLGDGQLIADSFQKAMTDEHRAATMVRQEQVSPGTNLLYLQAARIATTRFGETAAWGIGYLNCILGVFFLYVLFGVVRQANLSSLARMWLLVLTLSSGTMLLFFGYVENYTPMFFLLFLYVVNSLLVFHNRGRLWLSVLLLLLAVYAHIQAVLFVPSLIFLVVWALARGRPMASARAATLIAASIFIAVVVGAAFTVLGTYLLPVFTRGDTPGLLSVAHWVDMANELMLLVPAIPLVAAMLWAGHALDRRGGRKSKPDPGTWDGSPDEWRFAQLMLFPCLVYLLLFEPAIGMVRDWDLFAMTSLGLVPLALLAINRLMRHIPSRSDAATFAGPAIVLTVVLAAAWIGVNASADRSTTRFERMFDYDTVHAPYAYENLATYYYRHGEMPRAIECMKTASGISHNPRRYLALALYYDENGDTPEALEALTKALASRPAYSDARLLGTVILAREGRIEDLAAFAREGTVHNPEQAVFWFHLGQSLILMGKTDEGVAALRTALDSKPTAQLAVRADGLIQQYSGGTQP